MQDKNVNSSLKKIVDYRIAKEYVSFKIPKEHQKLVLSRFNKVREDPDRLLDWDNAKKMLKGY